MSAQSIPNKLVFEVLETFTPTITANYYKLDVGPKEYEFVVIAEQNHKDQFQQITMKTATHFFLDISIEFVVATLKKTGEDHYCLQLSIIFDSNSKKKGSMNGDITNLMTEMAYGGDYSSRKSAIKNLPYYSGANYSVVEN